MTVQPPRSSDGADSPAFLILSGTVAAVALGQIVGSVNGGIAPTVLAFALAVLTVVGLSPSRVIKATVEWTFGAVAIAVAVPALQQLFSGTGCAGGLNQRAQIAALVVFTLTFLVAATYGIVIRANWSDLPGIGVSVIGFMEAALFWSEPAAWSIVGREEASLWIALFAALLCGTIVGLKPKIGLGLVGGVLALGAVGTLVTQHPVCGNASVESALTVPAVYLVAVVVLAKTRSVLFR